MHDTKRELKTFVKDNKDIFDKLDEGRVANLLTLVNTEDFGQIFITDTHPQRMQILSETLSLQHTTFEILDNGEIQSL